MAIGDMYWISGTESVTVVGRQWCEFVESGYALWCMESLHDRVRLESTDLDLENYLRDVVNFPRTTEDAPCHQVQEDNNSTGAPSGASGVNEDPRGPANTKKGGEEDAV